MAFPRDISTRPAGTTTSQSDNLASFDKGKTRFETDRETLVNFAVRANRNSGVASGITVAELSLGKLEPQFLVAIVVDDPRSTMKVCPTHVAQSRSALKSSSV